MLLEGSDDARYVVVFDPLDGSSNIDASIPTGEFFFSPPSSCFVSHRCLSVSSIVVAVSWSHQWFEIELSGIRFGPSLWCVFFHNGLCEPAEGREVKLHGGAGSG